MLNQLRSIFSQVKIVLRRPRLLLRGGNQLKWPIERVWAEWKFESISIDEHNFVAFMTGAKAEDVKNIFNYLDTLPPDSPTRGRPLLYALVRLSKPSIVVETGVADGQSTAAITQALHDNMHGMLFSIDLPFTERMLEDGDRQVLPPGRGIGYFVPKVLGDRWQLILGDAREKLPELLSNIGQLDIFLHDSLHTERHMMWEYETAWPYLKTGSALLSHDISVAFLKFSRRVDRPFYCTGNYHNRFGGILK